MNYTFPMKTLSVVKLGRLSDGFQRDHGRVRHALPEADYSYGTRRVALCGTRPGKRSVGFAHDPEHPEVTCPRCLSKLRRAGQATPVEAIPPAAGVEALEPWQRDFLEQRDALARDSAVFAKIVAHEDTGEFDSTAAPKCLTRNAMITRFNVFGDGPDSQAEWEQDLLNSDFYSAAFAQSDAERKH